jgi:sugar-specific transcriptional regulator TrmB
MGQRTTTYVDHDDELDIWQELIIDLWDEMDLWDPKMKDWSSYRRVMEDAPRMYLGKDRNAVSAMCREVMSRSENTVLVVPNELYFKRQRTLLREEHRCNLWQSRPLDIVPQDTSKLTRDDVLNKTFEPFVGSVSCIVDGASLLSRDEIKLIRSVEWKKYMELG